MRTTTADIHSLISAIERREIRLPELQRSYVWKPAQVAGLLDSLYRRYPSGSLLLWETEVPVSERKLAVTGPHGKPMTKPQYLLDGQQRMTSLHRVFTGHERARVVFNVETERFQIESAATKKDPHWVPARGLLTGATDSFELVTKLAEKLPNLDKKAVGKRLAKIEAIAAYPYFIEIIEGLDYEEVTEIFVRVNSRGRPLRTTDLALATLSARWPGVVERFEAEARFCSDEGFPALDFTFLVRSLAAIASETTSPGDFAKLSEEALSEAWDRMHRGIVHLLKLLKGSADIATSTLIPSVNALIPLVAYLGLRADEPLDASERDALLYWLFGAFILARFSRSGETNIAQDVAAIRSPKQIEGLYRNLGLLGQRLVITEEMLADRGAGSAYFLFSYLVARREKATDWWHGVPICTDATGAYAVEYHHIHPRATLKGKYSKAEINDLANLAFISGKANKKISRRSPSKYFPDLSVDELEAHFVPVDEKLRTADAYPDFVHARRRLLADAMTELLDSYRPAFLGESAAGIGDPTAGEALVIETYGSAPEASDAVVHFSAVLDSETWKTAIPLIDLVRFVVDLENGLAGDIVVGGEETGVEAGAEDVQVPIGGLLVTGTVEEWRKVLDRELDEMAPRAEAPDLGAPEPWKGERREFPVLDSE